MNSPLKWHGGKHYLAEWIIERMPPHTVYAEAFGGGASVLLRKQAAPMEAYNDIYSNVVQFFQVLRDHRDKFIEYVSLIPYSQEEFSITDTYEGESSIESAAWDFVRWRQSFGGQGKSWSSSTTRSRGGRADCVNGWRNAIEGLWDVSERLLDVQIHCENAFQFIKRFNWTGAVIYCDPPYIGETRKAKTVYQHEMSDHQHGQFCNLVNTIHYATVMVSGYDNELYNACFTAANGWEKHTKEISNHAAGGAAKRRMLECLWIKRGNRGVSTE